MPEGKRRRAPKNCFWRGPTLWGRVQVRRREYKFSLRTSESKTAQRRLAAEQQRLVAASYFGEHRHSYESVFIEWSAHIVTQVAPNTARRYNVSLDQLEADLAGKFIDEIDKALIVAMIKRRRDDGASTATIRRDLTALSSVLEYAEDHDYREGNPALDRLRKLKERRDPIVLPDPEYIQRMIARAPGTLAALIDVAWRTGCRLGELVSARRGQFDRARKQLTVHGKGNKVRVIDLDARSYEILAALPPLLGQAWLFHEGGNPFRHLSSRFRYLVRAEMRAARKAAAASGQEPDFRAFTFHHLRHRHAVDWLKSGRSIYDLQQRLGHTSVKTTEIYLAFLTPEEARTAKYGSAQ